MAKAWLMERWKTFLPALQAATSEEEIAALCAAEIAAWRARPGMLKASSLRNPLTDTRAQIKALKVEQMHAWMNPRTQNREHIALKYLNFSESEWTEMDRPSDERIARRVENQQLINQPELIVRIADHLLDSLKWEEIVVGLAVTTGRRLTEVLVAGKLIKKTAYSVIFSGQLKRRDLQVDPYEVPTLVEADRVMDAWDRARRLMDCSKLDQDTVSTRYGPAVKEAAQRAYAHKVPTREEKDLYTHLFRTIYGRLAVYYYCPAYVVDLTYLSTIYGHYKETKGNKQKEHDYAATLHYFDYKIGDGAGNVDGRQGIRLGERDVEVLEVFKRPDGQDEQKNEAVELLTTSKTNKTGYSSVRPKSDTKAILLKISDETGVKDNDELLRLLIADHYEVKQLREMVGRPAASNPVASAPEIEALIASLSREIADPVAYLRGLIQKDANFHAGLEKRYKDLAFEKMSFAQLMNYKTIEAANERIRRVVAAIIAHNEREEPLKQWYINQAAIWKVSKGRKEIVADWLEAHKEEVDAHNKKFNLSQKYNSKPIAIEDMIKMEDTILVENSVPV